MKRIISRPLACYCVTTRRLLLGFLIGITLMFGVARQASAAGITFGVNSTGDGADATPGNNICETAAGNGVCTLRAAIQEVNARNNGGDTIAFNIPSSDPGCSAGVCTITLGTALPAIATGVNISGPGASFLTISGNNAVGVFDVSTPQTVNFSGLTIANGNSVFGGGGIRTDRSISSVTVNVTDCVLSNNAGSAIRAVSGTVNVTSSILTGNSATQGGAIYAAISSSTGFAFVTVRVTSSVISNNTATGGGGGIYTTGAVNGSSIAVNPLVVITNSTLSGNSASNGTGGGIWVDSLGVAWVVGSTLSGNSANAGGGVYHNGNSGSQLQVTNSTLAGNSAGSGGGGGIVVEFLATSGSTANIESSIVALNTASGCCPDVSGSFSSKGFNLIGKSDGSIGFTVATDRTGTIASPLDPKLDPAGLQNNGGPTQTIALLSGSPAIDQGTSSGLTGTLTVDQRGVGYSRTVNEGISRPPGGDGTDIGAFEFGAHIDAISQKTHGPNPPDPSNTFGIPLPLTGTFPGIECRRNTGADTSGPNVGRDHRIVLTFPTAVTVTGASVTSSNASDMPTATASASSNVVTVDLHNVPNTPDANGRIPGRRLLITLTSVSDGTNTNDVAIPMGVLLGDVNGSARVDAADVSLVRQQALQPITSSNFREDINVSGRVDAADVSIARQQTLASLP